MADLDGGVDGSPGAARVAVAVVHWGNKSDTIRCLRSVETSPVPANPLLVVDNGTGVLGDPEMRAVAPQAVFAALPENVGFAAAANIAIRRSLAAGSDYVFLLNNDAVLLPGCLGELIRVAETSADIGAVGAKVLSFTEPERLWMAYGELTYGAALVRLIGQGDRDGPAFARQRDVDTVPGCAMLLSGRALAAVGYLDEQFFAYHEDVDWCTRARARGFRIVFAPDAHVAHRGGASLVNNPHTVHYLTARNTILFARKHARVRDWMRLALTVGGSLARDWLRGAVRGDTTTERALSRGYVDGLLGRTVPYEALGLRPARAAADLGWRGNAQDAIRSESAG